MKRSIPVIVMVLVCLFISGCGKPRLPEKAVDGLQWDSSWTTVDSMVGIELPADFTQTREEGINLDKQTFYYVWTRGDEIKYTVPAEDPAASPLEKSTFDAQIHYLLEECNDETVAGERIAAFEKIGEEKYTYTDTFQKEINGQIFSITTYELPEDGGPAQSAASANALRGSFAIHIDVLSLEEDPLPVLEEFLTHCHYAK